MVHYSDILGMNTRNVKYLRANGYWGKHSADSKLATKKVLKRAMVPHPKLIKLIRRQRDLQEFDWLSLKTGFVIKPSEGLGGEGIWIIRRQSEYAGEWLTMGGRKVNIEDLKLHASDILDGQYSRNRTPDQAFIEERITIHPKFKKYAFKGTPDLRVIVYSGIPVMAMLRLPSRESDGKANLHQGAIGVGIDLSTGITTNAVHYDSIITKIPGSSRKVNGIVIPFWEKCLKIAVDAQSASRLSYTGVDIVIDEENGPLVIELNAQPGLQIQIANMDGLYGRLKRVENLEVTSQYKGVQIAQVLFAESFSDKVKLNFGRKVLGVFEEIKVVSGDRKLHKVMAKMDTGALNASIDREFARELGLLGPDKVLYEANVESALGKQRRPVIELELNLGGQKIRALASVADRAHLKAKVLIGKRYLQGFMIDPAKV
jgi:alpha-L-glutamate ligase-like protein